MHTLDDIEISLRLSFEKAGIILTIKYHPKISVLNLRKYRTIKIDCNSRLRLTVFVGISQEYSSMFNHSD